MALSRKKLAIGALALALAGGIEALFPQSGSKTEGKYEKQPSQSRQKLQTSPQARLYNNSLTA